MPPPKKAAKKVAKKAAKKGVKHADPKHHELKDLRRAYEHSGRVEFLIQHLPQASASDVSTLTSLAQQHLAVGAIRNAAELLRAAEHLSFAALLAGAAKQGNPSPTVVQAVQDEYEHLVDSAEGHWEDSTGHPRPIVSLYKQCIKDSRKALAAGAYRQALELIRAAGALAKIEAQGQLALKSGSQLLAFR